jgi:ribonuclease HI
MTQWIHKWKRNNWMTASKEPVKNKESLMELDSVMPLMEEVQWVLKTSRC